MSNGRGGGRSDRPCKSNIYRRQWKKGGGKEHPHANGQGMRGRSRPAGRPPWVSASAATREPAMRRQRPRRPMSDSMSANVLVLSASCCRRLPHNLRLPAAGGRAHCLHERRPARSDLASPCFVRIRLSREGYVYTCCEFRDKLIPGYRDLLVRTDSSAIMNLLLNQG